jgi:hypothetical protein
MSPENKAIMLRTIRGVGAFYIGENANQANEPLARFLETDFLIITPSGRIDYNIIGLINSFDYANFPDFVPDSPSATRKAHPAP